MNHLSTYPLRPDFSSEQIMRTENLGLISEEQREARRRVRTHPIDNVEPEVAADRDDGIFVEAAQAGDGYRVHVTIADVAGYIPLKHDIARLAVRRGATRYLRGGSDPMFGTHALEHRMSLEHQKERLGLTFTIDLDAQFHPTHFMAEPVITAAETLSYASAQQRMQDTPQFMLMSRISQGLRSRIPQELMDEVMHAMKWRARSITDEQAMEMVASFMILANNCGANYYQRTGLPFAFRNFDKKTNFERAEYSIEARRHHALEQQGLVGHYSHLTSPIRRAPDFLNSHIIHYSIDVLDQAQRMLQKALLDTDPDVLRRALWDRGPEMLQHVRGKSSVDRLAIDRQLRSIAATLGDGTAVLEDSVVRDTVRRMTRVPLPIEQDVMQRQLDHINALRRRPDFKRDDAELWQFEQAQVQMDRIRASRDVDLDKYPAERFTSLLRASAMTGDMPRALFDEAVQRIRTGKYSRVDDGAIILIASPNEDNYRWRELKRMMCRNIKHDPTTVSEIIRRAKAMLAPLRIDEAHSTLPIHELERSLEDSQEMHWAILQLRSDGTMPSPMQEWTNMSSPYASIGHNKRSAVSHARYAFLEHYAFGELELTNSIPIPNHLYAELEHDGNKRAIVEKMAAGIGAALTMETQPLKQGGFMTSITLSGGELNEPIQIKHQDADAVNAEQTALRRLLRNRYFKYAVSEQTPDIMPVMNPQQMLISRVHDLGGMVNFLPPLNYPKGGRSNWSATVELVFGSEKMSFTMSRHNKDRAVRAACVKALESGGLIVEAPQAVQSWVSDEQTDRLRPGLRSRPQAGASTGR